METIFDLPTHALVVHLPVVLVPAVCVAAVAVALRPTWRRRYGWVLVGATAVALVSTLLAVFSGQAFDDLLDGAAPTEKHKQLGETTRLLVIGLFVAVTALVAGGAWADRRGVATTTRTRTVGGVLLLATVALSVLSTVWMVRTGHEGARITWEGVVE